MAEKFKSASRYNAKVVKDAGDKVKGTFKEKLKPTSTQ